MHYMTKRIFISTFLVLAYSVISFAAVHYVSDYGAKGDGVTDDAKAIQKCIDACSADGGGDVVFNKGKVFLSGPVEIKPYVNIILEQQSVFGAQRIYISKRSAIFRRFIFKSNRQAFLLAF